MLNAQADNLEDRGQEARKTRHRDPDEQSPDHPNRERVADDASVFRLKREETGDEPRGNRGDERSESTTEAGGEKRSQQDKRKVTGGGS